MKRLDNFHGLAATSIQVAVKKSDQSEYLSKINIYIQEYTIYIVFIIDEGLKHFFNPGHLRNPNFFS